MSAIALDQVNYSAGSKFAVKNLTLNVPEGVVYGFLGPNGAGKTTSIRLLLGLLRPTSGSISVLGVDIIREAPKALAKVGYVPEQPHFDTLLPVHEILRLQSAFYPRWDTQFAAKAVDDFELDATRPFGRLSKGQKAKVMLLCALAQQPDLLILDEPTDGLDPVARRDLLTQLLDYVDRHRATVLVSSHLVHELEQICSWMGVMDAGRLVLEGPIDAFRAGIKRVEIGHSPGPFSLPAGGGEVLSSSQPAPGVSEFTVQNWDMFDVSSVQAAGGSVRAVRDVSLEDGYVELLRAFRRRRKEG